LRRVILASAARTASARVCLFSGGGDLVSCFVSVRAAGIVGSICVDAVGACSAGCIRIGPVPPDGGCLLGMDGQRGPLIFVRPAQIGTGNLIATPYASMEAWRGSAIALTISLSDLSICC
jgi:hypothetical protein